MQTGASCICRSTACADWSLSLCVSLCSVLTHPYVYVAGNVSARSRAQAAVFGVMCRRISWLRGSVRQQHVARVHRMPPVHLCRFRLRIFRALCCDAPPLQLPGGVEGRSPPRFFLRRCVQCLASQLHLRCGPLRCRPCSCVCAVVLVSCARVRTCSYGNSGPSAAGGSRPTPHGSGPRRGEAPGMRPTAHGSGRPAVLVKDTAPGIRF